MKKNLVISELKTATINGYTIHYWIKEKANLLFLYMVPWVITAHGKLKLTPLHKIIGSLPIVDVLHTPMNKT